MDEKEKEKQLQEKTPNWVSIVVAVIGALGAIIAAFIIVSKTQSPTIEIILADAETKQIISGQVFVDTNEDSNPSYPEKPASIKLKKETRFIRATSEGYEPAIVTIDSAARFRIIEMKKITAITAAAPIPFSFSGWRGWNDEITLTEGAAANEIIVNGSTNDSTGFSHNSLNTNLRGRTLVLYFSNTRASSFSQSRMVKLAYNRDDRLLRPVNASLVQREYLPAEDTSLDNGIEYIIPDDFDGKLNFVFYQADLRNLEITAWYR